MSLKDDAGLVKMYGFIDVMDYQKVVVTDSSKGIEAAANNYLNNVSFDINSDKLIDRNIVIKNINTANIDGNTYYYFTTVDNKKYYVSINVDSKRLPFVSVGDRLDVKIFKESEVTEIIEILK